MKKLKLTVKSILLAFLFTACNPVEIALIEEITEEAVIIEKDLFDKPTHTEQQAQPVIPVVCQSDQVAAAK